MVTDGNRTSHVIYFTVYANVKLLVIIEIINNKMVYVNYAFEKL